MSSLPALRKVFTDDAVDVSATSTLVLSKNERRKWATIINSSNEDMWIRFGAAAEVGKGIYLSGGGFGYEISGENLWIDEIYAIHGGAGSKKLAVLELG